MSDESLANDDDSLDDIELAYREALKSIDDAESQVGSALMELAGGDDESDDTEESTFTSIGDALAQDLEADTTSETLQTLQQDTQRVSPAAVVEAALFVGGDVSLTARRLASLIGQETDARLAVKLIDQLNENYIAENRPYEIQLHEGGFKLELREEFADVQAKVFGLGPREVKLTPDTIEVLAFVAYNQPVTKEDLDELNHSKPLTVIRQLVRLQLLEVERIGKRRSDIAYVTGERFLKLFGLESIEDLPQADIFNFK